LNGLVGVIGIETFNLQEPVRDFRLKLGSAAMRRGVALSNTTDGYSGGVPDPGALEAGQPLPHYGPRP